MPRRRHELSPISASSHLMDLTYADFALSGVSKKSPSRCLAGMLRLAAEYPLGRLLAWERSDAAAAPCISSPAEAGQLWNIDLPPLDWADGARVSAEYRLFAAPGVPAARFDCVLGEHGTTAIDGFIPVGQAIQAGTDPTRALTLCESFARGVAGASQSEVVTVAGEYSRETTGGFGLRVPSLLVVSRAGLFPLDDAQQLGVRETRHDDDYTTIWLASPEQLLDGADPSPDAIEVVSDALARLWFDDLGV